ncbi:MAG: hypothetical protein ACD_3C00086G0004 [uncultured bacterium (gcode 4)]|uniref:Uncharacterized protein n=1 Tax=uncultured bacterium (gcode 4) TaxID=1234023 RepID=K2GXN3_9BACT|nr:MAG: hypothetical protein ACD_3C00086G0004 [uncultured bacterium (gcode 4)]
MINSCTEDLERIPSEKVCDTTLEALRSKPAKRVLELSLEKYWSDKQERDYILRIFDDIINNHDISEEDIKSFKKILKDEKFVKNYYKILDRIAFKDVTNEELKNLFEKLEFFKVASTLKNLIVKSKLLEILRIKETDSKSNEWYPDSIPEQNIQKASIEAEKIDKNHKWRTFVEIEGNIYEQIQEGIFRTTLNEEIKIYDLQAWKLVEILWIKEPETITRAERNIKWLDKDIIAFYIWSWDFISLGYLFRPEKKIIDFRWSFAEAKLIRVWEDVKLDRKWRIFVSIHSTDILMIDPINMEIIAHNVNHSFDYNWKEYFINIDRISFFSEVYSKETWFVCRLDWIKNLDELEIDEKNWVITYGWIIGLMKKKIQLM